MGQSEINWKSIEERMKRKRKELFFISGVTGAVMFLTTLYRIAKME